MTLSPQPHPSAASAPSTRQQTRATPLHSACISAVTEAELRYGLAMKPGATALHASVTAFLRHVQALPWDSAAALAFGELRAGLEAKCTPFDNLDTLMAAHALASGCTLATHDKAFARIPGLVAEDWMTPPR